MISIVLGITSVLLFAIAIVLTYKLVGWILEDRAASAKVRRALPNVEILPPEQPISFRRRP